jgi:hypothetical protein
MAICKTCGKKYSKWTTPVSARGACRQCFEAELGHEAEIEEQRQQDSAPASTMPETQPTKPMVPIRLSSFLPRSRSKVVFALVMGCYCIVVGSFMATWTWAARLPRPPRAFYLIGDAPDVLGLLIFGPLIESLMLVGVFELVRRLRAPDWAQVFTSALFISELHVWPWWPHALIVLPSFLIQSASYFYWRRASWKEAFWVLVYIHSINNVIPALNAVGHAMRHA